MSKPDLSDYKEVSERIADFRDKHPEGSLQSEIHTLTDQLVVVKAYAYRTPDDPRPGTGLASEPIPGKTPYTRDSELMNCETSAFGRAIIAVGASTASKVASANEVRNRQVPAKDSPEHIAVLEQVEEALQAAEKAGVTVDREKAVGYARESYEAAEKALANLRKRTAEAGS